MSWTPEALALVNEFRGEQLDVAAWTSTRVAKAVIDGVNPDDIDAAIRPVAEEINAIAATGAAKQAELVEQFLRAFIASQAIRVADSLVDQVVGAALRGSHGLGADAAFYIAVRPKEMIKQGMAPGDALRASTAMTSGAVQRKTLDVSTEPVLSFTRRAGLRYYRSTAWGACGFCVMLAGRGAVYSETSKSFKSHPGCRCSAYPATKGTDISALGQVSHDMWYRIAAEQPWASAKDNLSVFRREWKKYQVEHGIITP